MVPDVVPTFKCDKGNSVWGDATCIIPWNLYCFYGDKTILERHYGYMKAWLKYIKKIDGDHHGWRSVYHYGDWLALDSPYKGSAQTRGGTDEGYIADVYYRKSVIITAKTARILGKESEAFEYEQLAQKIQEGLVEEYFSSTGRCCIATQTAALLNLHENIHATERAAESLKILLENNENKLATGFVGTPILCEVLTEIGLEKEAFDILLNEEYPGWLYEVKLGATTIWERWNSLDETGHISSTGMNSLNHYAYGAIMGWIWKDVVGLRCLEEEPGFRKVHIHPHVNWKLQTIDAVYDSPAGQYKIFLELPDLAHIHMKFEIPEGCSAIIELPFFNLDTIKEENPLFNETDGDVCYVRSGIYDITYETTVQIAQTLSIDVKLIKIMANSEAKKMLFREFPQIANLMSYTGDYPLSETMRNLKYDEGLIQKLDGLLKEIM
jgi:alpha-L-rhamnosidase